MLLQAFRGQRTQEGMQGKVLLVGWAEPGVAALGAEPHICSKRAQMIPILPIGTGQVLPALVRRLAPTKASLQCCSEELKAGPLEPG